MNATDRPAENLRRGSSATGSGSNSTPVYCDAPSGRYYHKPKGAQVEATHFCYQCERFYLCSECLKDHSEDYPAHKISTNISQANSERMRLKLYGKAMPSPAASDIITKRLVYGLDEERELFVVENFPFVQHDRRVPMITLLGKSGVGKSTIAAHLVHEDEAKAGFVPIVAERGTQSTTMGVTYFKGEIGNQDKMDVDVLDFEGFGGSEKTHVESLSGKAYVEALAGKVQKSLKFEGLKIFQKRHEAVKAYLLPLAYLLADAVIMVMPQAALAEECEEFLTYLSKMSKQQVQHDQSQMPHLVIIFNQSAGDFERNDMEEAVKSQLQNRFTSVRCYTLPNFNSGPQQMEDFTIRLTLIQENLRAALEDRFDGEGSASRHDRPYRMEDMFKFIVPRLPPYLQEKDQPIMLHSLIPGNVATDWHLRFADDFNERFIKQINIPALAKNHLLKTLMLIARSMMVFRMCCHQLLVQPFNYSAHSPQAHQFNEGMNAIVECIENRLPCSAVTEYEYMRNRSNPKCGLLSGGHGKQHRSEGKCLKKFVPFFKTLFTRQSGFKDYHQWPEQGESGGDYVRHPDLLECGFNSESTRKHANKADENSSSKSDSVIHESGINVEASKATSKGSSLSLFSKDHCEIKQDNLQHYFSHATKLASLQDTILKELQGMPKKGEFISFLSSQKQTLPTGATSKTQLNPSSPEQATPQFFSKYCSLCLGQDSLNKNQCGEKNHQACGNCKLVISRSGGCWICETQSGNFPLEKSETSQPPSKAPATSFFKRK
eukprot:TRINITY_DN1_c0_g1_i4.p1 TRINITY_DN1_c0_g1~~TRINITY_DN1_c0_g1_i4.p1  ORF type:complete len:774 (+),score=115.62 TRINITY_DN1_c0_g1_i4:49-2370(+)